MEVLLLTTLFSVVFAIFFLTLFLRERQNRRFGGIEREALLPLEEEMPDQASSPEPRPSKGESPGTPSQRKNFSESQD